MSLQEKFTEETVLWVKRHSPKLMTFAITRPESYRFAAGQFARLGFREGAGYIWRAYSFTSAEYADTLEFFAVLIEDGAMSANLANLQANDKILLDKTAQGFFLPQRFPDGRDLIMLSTGSGIAPFLSILQQPEIWQRFETLALAHCVSYNNDLIFNQQISDLAEHPLIGEFAHKLRFVPMTTRENDGDNLHFRLPESIQNHALEQAFNLQFTREHSRFMICGNPAMVQDTFQTLLNLGYAMHRNKVAGQIMMENGF
ncbi:ferredoxin--NADP reductase [Alysiella crassa]|uniref:ferredoxin--NADP(+) reductase n=1 Tax=Alysiella crassa TaxID=153491 RepID=A0A376BSF3_9NEIS|nr:ferredoxin--NADP reductase [Alysiella crassa]UOP07899.1 ferredoxin--NADP reductase [Alysiella crassa]SSY79829.1 Ferredoxin--NADP reductase [Alysiella crassa]